MNNMVARLCFLHLPRPSGLKLFQIVMKKIPSRQSCYVVFLKHLWKQAFRVQTEMAYIDEWASIQKEHESALFATTNDLQARSLSLPITGGVKADLKSLKLIVFSTIQVLQATISCIQSTLSKATITII
ncbi:AUGMIN subunit 8 isoform X3 [Helianthus annuus]|uniref:AUGMIN subunit 8 isoform X3 n=1 Tax=Helianthus annuus TaxID=4232 RepID=UPI000B8F4F1A|nr:AUGMIN subunit 8 isoform X3 [Helianthus annuus]